MNNTNYDFPVELQPVFLSNGQEIVNRKAVVRTDSMDTLGLVSNDYGLVKHSTVIDSFREAGQEFGVSEKISMINNGANLFYQMTFPKVQMEVKKGDIVKMMMIAKNSYNGGNSLQVIFGAFRLVCSNGMILGTQFLSFNFRHVGNVGDINSQQFKDACTNYIRLFGEKTPQITAMANKQISVAGLFNPKEVDLPDYLLKEAFVEYGKANDHTVWGYYNALTFAVTHRMKKENPQRAIWYGMEAWKAAERVMV